MAGLVPAIYVFFTALTDRPCMAGSVYIMTNRRNGTLYVGVTSDLVRRVWEHREGVGSSFVRRYGLTRLVYFGHHEDIRTAIQRETSLKRWPRSWKVRLLAAGNPDRVDLYASLLELKTWMAGGSPGHGPAMTIGG
jgi:putative endonuclease